ncbi:hypothetical protein PMI16_00194 [Herbaspirillum sp. CF444]|nr:hypothetical protein PMI16_00194 [Herbaspirillum sp. CF444]
MTHVQNHIADDEVSTEGLAQRNGRQIGDPRKTAQAIFMVLESDQPPLHLLPGVGALLQVGKKLSALQEELGKWGGLSVNTSFAEA